MNTIKSMTMYFAILASLTVCATDSEISTPLDTTGGRTIDVATGDTLIYRGKITGNGTLTKTGGGTLALANGENDFSGGVKINAGYVRADVAGCFGTGPVYAYNDGAAGGLVFAASNAEFANRFYKQTKNGMYMNFKANTAFSSRVDAMTTPTFVADSGVTAVFKNLVNIATSAGAKDITCAGMKGTLVFEGTLVVAQLTESVDDNAGGKIVLAGTDNQVKSCNLNSIVYVCSNVNVVAGVRMLNREGVGYLDLNGFDQTVRDFIMPNSSVAYYNHSGARITSDTAAILTIDGNVAGVTLPSGTSWGCNNQIDGKVSLVLDADPAYTNKFLHRRNLTTGDITVKSGVFNLGGSNSSFGNVPKISVESDGEFLLDTSAANALASVTNLSVASGGRFTVTTGSIGTPTTPFTDGLVNLELASNSELRLIDNTSITVNTLKVNSKPMYKGTYTSAKCPAIKSGTVVVLNGPPKGINVSFR